AGVLGTFLYEGKMPAYRGAIGRFIGGSGKEIAVLRNTSEGAQVLAASIDWEPGDEIVLSDNEFPANAHPWLGLRRRGVVIRYVDTERERLTPDVLRPLMSARTKVVAVSWVSFEDGYMHDLAALAEVTHERDALFCVDAIQGLGAFSIDVRAQGIDALYCGGAKWMMALQGVAFLYVAESLIERLTPLTPGWRSVADIWDFLNYDQPLAADATRYEGGTPNFIGALSLDRAIDVFERSGMEAIASHVLGLTDRLVDGLTRHGANILSSRTSGTRSGIVTFTLPGADPVELGKALQTGGFVTTYRASGVRVSPHGYNSAEEIDAFVEAATERGKALACIR
ncbi:MAG: aminotransferase class V-fold PLP-dependent enzyme, partial [Candidatus Eremiobacteraeota bacterium]|nr:aminotransferase class V-fold PLP-dependent enzyme [Candidatus Eremiobacteraeota bacterium]